MQANPPNSQIFTTPNTPYSPSARFTPSRHFTPSTPYSPNARFASKKHFQPQAGLHLAFMPIQPFSNTRGRQGTTTWRVIPPRYNAKIALQLSPRALASYKTESNNTKKWLNSHPEIKQMLYSNPAHKKQLLMQLQKFKCQLPEMVRVRFSEAIQMTLYSIAADIQARNNLNPSYNQYMPSCVRRSLFLASNGQAHISGRPPLLLQNFTAAEEAQIGSIYDCD